MGLGRFAPLAVAIAAMLIGGTIVAIRSEGVMVFLRRAAVPSVLVVSAVLTMSAAAPSRFFTGPEAARAGRYIGVMAALTLPAVAVAADALARRWKALTPWLIGLLLVPIPFNAFGFEYDRILTRGYFENLRVFTTSLPDNPLAAQVPPWIRPNETIVGQPDMTIGWLLDARRRGELPRGRGLPESAEPFLRIQLGVAATRNDPNTIPKDPMEATGCTRHTEPVGLEPSVGDRLTFQTPVRVAGRHGFAPSTPWITFLEGEVEVTLPELRLIVAPAADEDHFVLCQ
jgi:hypothetical protein